jgi:hydroxyacyl-ACP dehydratase HTD2-like protein with hotdog domain
LLYEDFTPDQSRKLAISLAPFIETVVPDTKPAPSSSKLLLPPAHHLVYNNPIIPSNSLLPDGTDPLQSPGSPFVRRMWAGGSVTAGPKIDSLTMDGGKLVTMEGIRDVTVKGRPGEEKIFVGIERRMMKLDDPSEGEDSIRARIWKDTAEDFGDAALIERRNIVFMYERSPAEIAAIKEGKPGKPPKQLMRKSTTLLSNGSHC